MRTEKDNIGSLQLSEDAVYGIHTLRALNNFPVSGEKINPHFIKAYFQVKLAAVETNYKVGLIEQKKYEIIVKAIENLIAETNQAIEENDQSIFNKIIVDPYQGVAGTSLNMNVNEVIANTALKLSDKNFGD